MPDTENLQNNSQEAADSEIKNTEADRISYFVDDISKKLDDEKIPTAIIAIIDPQSQDPILIARGTNYNLTKLCIGLGRHFKSKLDEELSI